MEGEIYKKLGGRLSLKTEWVQVQLKDVVSILGDGLHGTPKYDANGEYYFINGNNLSDGKIVFKSDTKRVDFAEYNKYKKDLNSRTILVSINGTLGNVALYNGEKCVLGKSACYFNVLENVDKQFIRYVVSAEKFRSYLHRFANGTTIKNVSLKAMREYPFLLPPVAEQRTISAVLSALDDKIENNRVINHHLEQMARAIFKSWVVDFEPFGGVMPDNWIVGSLTDIADYRNGLAMQKFRPAEGEVGLPVLKIKELRQGSCDLTAEFCSPNIRADFIVHDGDVIFSWSGSLMVDIWCGGDCGLNQHLFKVTSQKYGKWFYYLWICYHLAQFIALAADKATTMGHIKRDALEKAEVIIPDDDSYCEMSMLLAPIYEQIICNRVENRKLVKLRDVLLPRFMNGELLVKGKKWQEAGGDNV